MNILTGVISEITAHDSISLVKINWANRITFSSVVIDAPASGSYLQKGKAVNILFKETEVSLTKDSAANISIQNKIPCKVKSVRNGVVLCELELLCGETIIKSIITANASRQLSLRAGDEVTALIKSNEISLSPHD